MFWEKLGLYYTIRKWNYNTANIERKWVIVLL